MSERGGLAGAPGRVVIARFEWLLGGGAGCEASTAVVDHDPDGPAPGTSRLRPPPARPQRAAGHPVVESTPAGVALRRQVEKLWADLEDVPTGDMTQDERRVSSMASNGWRTTWRPGPIQRVPTSQPAGRWGEGPGLAWRCGGASLP